MEENGYVKKKRKLGPQACAYCRRHKVRCDGGQPCRNCIRSDEECVYVNEPAGKAKNDVILETVLRLEEQLSSISNRLALHGPRTPAADTASTLASPAQTFASTERRLSSVTEISRLLSSAQRGRNAELDNAILSPQHNSTTESVLAWPYFDVFPTLRKEHQPTFNIEQRRHPVATDFNEGMPAVDLDTIATAFESFAASVNYSYPVVSADTLADLNTLIAHGQTESSVEFCLALLVMSLGCASRVVTLIDHHWELEQKKFRHLSLAYFNVYNQRISMIHTETSTISTQCLFLTSLMFAYLQRPLQAWSFINLTASKCRCLLSYNPSDFTLDAECLRRIFWSCFILESDYIAELAALPQSGVGDIESSMPYPGFYRTDPEQHEQSSLYFLACVSMRRLLNRVHDLLYSPGEGVAFDDARFPQIVSELDNQLDTWRECLPQSLQFSIDVSPVASEHGGFLRQRYLTCRAVIYRPYLNQVLSRFHSGIPLTAEMIEKSEDCLNMCLLHILNLQAFSQTVLIDTWICSLSMASTTLLLLAACRVPELKHRISAKVGSIGDHLVKLLSPWTTIHGSEVSPSVKQSLEMIQKVDVLIKHELSTDDG